MLKISSYHLRETIGAKNNRVRNSTNQFEMFLPTVSSVSWQQTHEVSRNGQNCWAKKWFLEDLRGKVGSESHQIGTIWNWIHYLSSSE
jgi:hypothetical protein